MPYTIQEDGDRLVLELTGGVTARDVGEMATSVGSCLKAGAAVVVRTRGLEDIDTSVLQMLISTYKTTGTVVFEEPSEVLVNAVERCSLRRELLGGSREAV